MILETVEDRNGLQANGNSVKIKRKNGKTVSVPSMKEIAKLSSQTLKDPNDGKTAKDFWDKFPRIEEGDTLIIGADSSLMLSSGGHYKKDAGIDDGVGEKTIALLENAEAKVSGVKRYEKEDKQRQRKYIIESIKDIEVTKGAFNVISIGDGDEITTPYAVLKFHGSVGGFFDISPNGLYSFPLLDVGKRLEYVNRKTKKSYITKNYDRKDPVMPSEIVVNDSGIYKIPLTQQDYVPFARKAPMAVIKAGVESFSDNLPDQKKVAEQFANGEFQNQMFSSLEAFKQMTPEDMKRLAKMSGASEDQLKQLEQMPEMLAQMEKTGVMGEMKKAMATASNFYQGMGAENMGLMFKQQGQGLKEATEKLNGMMDEAKRMQAEYKPPKAEHKVA